MSFAARPVPGASVCASASAGLRRRLPSWFSQNLGPQGLTPSSPSPVPHPSPRRRLTPPASGGIPDPLTPLFAPGDFPPADPALLLG